MTSIPPSAPEPKVEKLKVDGLRAWFGASLALKGITMPVYERKVTAIIGPSGCGKSTFIRCLNRMHEVVPGARAEGSVLLDGKNILADDVDPAAVDQSARLGPDPDFRLARQPEREPGVHDLPGGQAVPRRAPAGRATGAVRADL